jgi:ABC-type glycerol-3-phosphate transport system substrate-binding protein
MARVEPETPTTQRTRDAGGEAAQSDPTPPTDRRWTRRRLTASAAASLAVGAVVGTACAGPGGSGPGAGPRRSGPASLRVHVVSHIAIGQWLDRALKENVDDWRQKQPDVTVTLETHGAWTQEYFPAILAFAASSQLGDVVWYPPRHRSHLSWGVKYGIVRDLTPIARTARYDMNQFYKGATEHNTWEGKQYWLSYISEPAVPIVAYNKTRSRRLGLPDPKDDWTFDELAEWARKATTAGGSVGGGGSAGSFGYFRGDSGTAAFPAVPYLRQWGVEPVDKTGKRATFMDTREAFIQALTFRHNLTNVWKVSPNPKDGAIAHHDWYGKEQRIVAQDVWPFRIQTYPVDYKDFESDFVLTPTVKRGDKRRSMLNEHVFGITPSSKVPEAAFAFLGWICGKEMSVQGALIGGKPPIARPDVWNDARLTDRWPAFKKLRTIMEAVEPDYPVANFRGEEFDAASNWIRLERGELPVLEMATEIQRLAQEVLNKESL